MGKDGRSELLNGPCGMAARNQYGALCWRRREDVPEVLLITSRDTGRWIIPKGWLIEAASPAETARQEAWEEAGVRGEVSGTSLGYFAYRKDILGKDIVPCVVEVFALEVDDLAKDFPEKDERRRKWFAPEKAARKVDEAELRSLILGFAQGLARSAGQGTA
jgi:8-oxo-dGTP pyrophosphatase MutT (NUDIX family)